MRASDIGFMLGPFMLVRTWYLVLVLDIFYELVRKNVGSTKQTARGLRGAISLCCPVICWL